MMVIKEDSEVFDPRFQHFDGKQWCLVQTRPRNEKFASQNFDAEGILVYLPLITKVEIHNRSKRDTLLPMFPGYLFACPTLEEESVIRRNKVVWNLKKLSEPEEQSLLHDLKIVRLCELQSAEHKMIVNPTLHPGDSVTIKSGSMKGTEAIIVRRENELTVIINLVFFNQNIQMRWSADDLIL